MHSTGAMKATSTFGSRAYGAALGWGSDISVRSGDWTGSTPACSIGV